MNSRTVAGAQLLEHLSRDRHSSDGRRGGGGQWDGWMDERMEKRNTEQEERKAEWLQCQ